MDTSMDASRLAVRKVFLMGKAGLSCIGPLGMKKPAPTKTPDHYTGVLRFGTEPLLTLVGEQVWEQE